MSGILSPFPRLLVLPYSLHPLPKKAIHFALLLTGTLGAEDDFVSVHIRVVGDWTGKLEELFNPERDLGLGL